MTRIIPPPSQHDLEFEFWKLLENGDITEIAKWLDKDRTTLSRQLNPNEPEHKSELYKSSRYIYVLDMVRPELGDGAISILSRRPWLSKATNGNVPELQHAMKKSLWQLVVDESEKLPMQKRIRYVERAQMALEKYRQGLMSMDMEDSPEIDEGSRVAS